MIVTAVDADALPVRSGCRTVGHRATTVGSGASRCGSADVCLHERSCPDGCWWRILCRQTSLVADSAARALAMTRRTLTHRLGEKAYRSRHPDVCAELSRALLQGRSVSIADVAFFLHYSRLRRFIDQSTPGRGRRRRITEGPMPDRPEEPARQGRAIDPRQ